MSLGGVTWGLRGLCGAQGSASPCGDAAPAPTSPLPPGQGTPGGNGELTRGPPPWPGCLGGAGAGLAGLDNARGYVISPLPAAGSQNKTLISCPARPEPLAQHRGSHPGRLRRPGQRPGRAPGWGSQGGGEGRGAPKGGGGHVTPRDTGSGGPGCVGDPHSQRSPTRLSPGGVWSLPGAPDACPSPQLPPQPWGPRCRGEISTQFLGKDLIPVSADSCPQRLPLPPPQGGEDLCWGTKGRWRRVRGGTGAAEPGPAPPAVGEAGGNAGSWPWGAPQSQDSVYSGAPQPHHCGPPHPRVPPSPVGPQYHPMAQRGPTGHGMGAAHLFGGVP